MGANLAAARDRHGHRLEPFSKLARGKPYRAFLHNLPTALARLDTAAGLRARRVVARAASGGCRSGIPETSSSYNGSDGTSVGLKTNADGSTTVQMSTSRQALVNMRLGYALAFSGAVSISGKVDGISLTRAELAAEELRTKASADEEFAKIMKQEIDRYRTLETGFDTPQACVQIAFSPTSGSTPVSAGRSGSFQVQLDLKSGSGPPTGKWKLVSQRAAVFSPPTSSGHQTTFRYSVPSNTSATQIAASLNATSKAGVATGDWTQPIKPTGLYLRIVGYTRSEQSSTTDGQMSITATLAGGQPGPVTAVPACTSPASCLTDVELDANVTSTESGYVTGPPDTCPAAGSTLRQPRSPTHSV